MVVTASAGITGAAAQSNSPTPFSTVPTAPKTLPLIGGKPVPDTAPHLLSAVAANDSSGVHALLAANVSPDESDEYGRTALVYAVMFDNAPIGQMLVDYGAKLDIRDKLGDTALYWAAARGNSDMLRLLLNAKATVDAPNRQGITPLMVAARNGRTEAVRLLLHYHADPRKNDYTGRDAVDWAENNAAIAQVLRIAAAR